MDYFNIYHTYEIIYIYEIITFYNKNYLASKKDTWYKLWINYITRLRIDFIILILNSITQVSVILFLLTVSYYI